MTQNAVAYFNVVEMGRSNRANEAETHRKNVEAEKHNRNVLAETFRHNLALEQLQHMQHQETARHNYANEGIGWTNIDVDWSRLAETARANRASEAELKRAHLTQEAEAQRHNKRTEMTGYVNAGSDLLKSFASMKSASAQQSQARTAKKRSDWEQKAQTHKTIQGYVHNASELWHNVNETARVGVSAIKELKELVPFSNKLFK